MFVEFLDTDGRRILINTDRIDDVWDIHNKDYTPVRVNGMMREVRGDYQQFRDTLQVALDAGASRVAIILDNEPKKGKRK